MAAINFNGFSVAVNCILVIYQKKLSISHMPDFAMAALLRRTEGA